MLGCATPTTDGEHALCWDLEGKEYRIPMGDVLDDGKEDSVVVTIPIEFPKGYMPPITFDSDRCMWCPFMCTEEAFGSYCDHKDYSVEKRCPVLKYFKKLNIYCIRKYSVVLHTLR